MSTTNVKFFKGAYGATTAASKSTDNVGGIVFDTTSKSIYVGGTSFGGNITDVTYDTTKQLLTISKAVGDAITMDFSDTASATATMNVFSKINQVIGKDMHVESGSATGKLNYTGANYLNGYGEGDSAVAAVTTLVDADMRLDALIKAINDEIAGMNGTATIASATDGVVTIKAGVKQTDGKIAQGEDADITLAKVATTGEADDVKTSTINPAAYSNVTNPFDTTISATWTAAVTANTLATTDTVEESLEKLDKKIAALETEIAADETAINNTFANVKNALGAEDDFTMDFSDLTGADAKTKTNVHDAIMAVEAEVTAANVTIDGHKGAITTGNGLTDVEAESGSFAVKAKENGYINVTADGVDVKNVDTEGKSTADTDLATVKTVTEHIKSLDNTTGETMASVADGVVTIYKTITETDGIIDIAETNNSITLAKVATTGAAADVTVTEATYGGTENTTSAQQALTNLAAAIEANEVTLADGEKVLGLTDEKVLSSTLTIAIEKQGEGDAAKDYIVLKGKDNAEVSKVDASTFVKDGMLSNAELVATAEEGITEEAPYIKLTWNTDAGSKVVRFSVKSLVDTYTSGDTDALTVNGYTITPNTGAVVKNAKTLTTGGQVYTAIAATKGQDIQTITGEGTTDETNQYIEVKVDASKDEENNYSLTTTANLIMCRVEDAVDEYKGLAEASDVKSYVDEATKTLETDVEDIVVVEDGSGDKTWYLYNTGKTVVVDGVTYDKWVDVRTGVTGEAYVEHGTSLLDAEHTYTYDEDNKILDVTNQYINSRKSFTGITYDSSKDGVLKGEFVDDVNAALYNLDSKINTLNNGIAALDADITSDDDTFTTVQVTEVDGKITDVVVNNTLAGVEVAGVEDARLCTIYKYGKDEPFVQNAGTYEGPITIGGVEYYKLYSFDNNEHCYVKADAFMVDGQPRYDTKIPYYIGNDDSVEPMTGGGGQWTLTLSSETFEVTTLSVENNDGAVIGSDIAEIKSYIDAKTAEASNTEVENKAATITVNAADATTLATVAGTDITAKAVLVWEEWS